MFHELRIPINAMFLAIGLLKEESKQEDARTHTDHGGGGRDGADGRRSLAVRDGCGANSVAKPSASVVLPSHALQPSSVEGPASASSTTIHIDEGTTSLCQGSSAEIRSCSHLRSEDGKDGGSDRDMSGVSTYLMEIIHSQCKSIQSILNESLDLQRLESNKLKLEFVPFSLRDLVLQVGHVHSVSAVAKGANIVTAIDSALPAMLLGDMQRIKQVLNNFVSNGTKFCEHGTDIRIDVHVQVGSRAAPQDRQPQRGAEIDASGWSDRGGDEKRKEADIGRDSSRDKDQTRSGEDCGNPVSKQDMQLVNERNTGGSDNGGDPTHETTIHVGDDDAGGATFVDIKVCVTNTGAGISKADIGGLFTPFKQIRAGELQNGGGSGTHRCGCYI